MGRALIEGVLSSPDLALSAALEVRGNPQLGHDAGEAAGFSSGIEVSADAGKALAGSRVLIDFTRPEGTLEHLAVCCALGVNMVIGTTGFSDEQKRAIGEAARKIAIVFAPNMAIGVNVTFKLAEVAAGILGEDYDVEIIEAHHRHKVDAPSGTALKLGEVVARALGDGTGKFVHGRHGVTGERERGAIGFHAVRGGDIVGEHTVMFAGPGERVEITVRSASRTTYAEGALRAARFLAARRDGLFDMQDVLGLA